VVVRSGEIGAVELELHPGDADVIRRCRGDAESAGDGPLWSGR